MDARTFPVSSKVLVSRRRFLQVSTGALAAGVFAGLSRAAGRGLVDSNRVALLSDLHIAGDPTRVARGVHLSEHLSRVVAEVLALEPRPANVLVTGDCALSDGQTEDYRQLRRLLKPLREAGVEVHIGLGNHDDRQRFWEVFPEASCGSPVPGKHVTVVETPRASWFLLDSLDKTKQVAGRLGKAQLQWLDRALAKRPDKPAVVLLHHNPDSGGKPSGLLDTAELLKVLKSHARVQALVYGHTHVFSVKRAGPFYQVNLPPVAYVFAKEQPSGWVDAKVGTSGLTLQLNALDKNHAQNGQRFELPWKERASKREAEPAVSPS